MPQEVAPSLFAMMILRKVSLWDIMELVLNVFLVYTRTALQVRAVAEFVRSAMRDMVEDIAHITEIIIAQSVQSSPDVRHVMRSLDARHARADIF